MVGYSAAAAAANGGETPSAASRGRAWYLGDAPAKLKQVLHP